MRFLEWTLGDVQAGALRDVHVELENAGSVAWRKNIHLSYHWLDERGNPLVWDGLRTELPRLEPGERAALAAHVRAPMPPGRYRFSLDLVAEHRAWFSELGSDAPAMTVDVQPRGGTPMLELPEWVTRTATFDRVVGGAHAEGYAVVAGAIDWKGGLGHPRPRSLDPYEPGTGRIPGFTHALVCPSVLDGIELNRVDDVAGLPAYAAPADEPWIYDGRAVLEAQPSRRATARSRSGRRAS